MILESVMAVAGRKLVYSAYLGFLALVTRCIGQKRHCLVLANGQMTQSGIIEECEVAGFTLLSRSNMPRGNAREGGKSRIQAMAKGAIDRSDCSRGGCRGGGTKARPY